MVATVALNRCLLVPFCLAAFGKLFLLLLFAFLFEKFEASGHEKNVWDRLVSSVSKNIICSGPRQSTHGIWRGGTS